MLCESQMLKGIILELISKLHFVISCGNSENLLSLKPTFLICKIKNDFLVNI